jgi:hypothetical protein
LGCARAQAENASGSWSKAITQLCACVPRTGSPSSRPASVFEVALAPPTNAAREAERPPSIPCARRSPNSITSSPRAASVTRAALVAISVSKLTKFRSAVSTSWACIKGPRTRTSGS